MELVTLKGFYFPANMHAKSGEVQLSPVNNVQIQCLAEFTRFLEKKPEKWGQSLDPNGARCRLNLTSTIAKIKGSDIMFIPQSI